MKSRKVKIIVVYRSPHTYENAPTSKERYTTTFTYLATTYIMDECYLLEFLPSLIREDIESVEVQEYVE